MKKNKINIANEQISDILTELKITINDNSFRKGEYQFNIPTSTFEIPDLSLNKIKPIPKKSQNPKINAEIEKSYTILIVEDELPLIEMLSDILGNFYKIHTAYNGLKAIELLKQEPIDIILSDIEMPDMNGLDMMEIIRKNPDYAPIPIIFLTAYDIPKMRIKGLEGGAQDYIIKPVNNQELLARIRVHLKQRELYSEVQELKRKMRKKGRSLETTEKIRLLVDYIDKNFSECLTRDNLSQTIDLSPDHMSRIFLEVTGKKIGDYINTRRLEFATKKLIGSDDTIISIAYEAGFESLRTFNRLFLKEFKENPANYRQKNRPE
ncbi:MAG: response regulator [Leptospira sp.]|nr:response regulator [Leptospira sp.]